MPSETPSVKKENDEIMEKEKDILVKKSPKKEDDNPDTADKCLNRLYPELTYQRSVIMPSQTPFVTKENFGDEIIETVKDILTKKSPKKEDDNPDARQGIQTDLSKPPSKCQAKLYDKGFIATGILHSSPISKVFYVQPQEDKNLVMIMKVYEFNGFSQFVFRKSENETKALKKLKDSAYFPSLIKIFTTPSTINLVMECALGGNLFHYFLVNKKELDGPCLQICAAQILHATYFMHKLGILHLDIKPKNILISKTGHIMLSDFDTSGTVKEVSRDTILRGTIGYIAPEIFENDNYSFSADSWSVGITLLQLFLKRNPYDSDETFEEIARRKITKPSSMSDEYWQLIQGLLNVNPELRLGRDPKEFHVIQNLPYFEGIIWKAIRQRSCRPPFWPVPQLFYESLEEPIEFGALFLTKI